MKKLLYLLFALLTFTSAAQAQTAKQVLDQTAAKLKKGGGLQATFKVGNFTDGKETGSGSGTIYVKGDRFHIDSPQMKTWFDGKTQWSYLEGSNEVNVSHPTQAELQSMNPYTFVNLYKQGYTYSLSTATLRGKACHEVTLTATSPRQGIRKASTTSPRDTDGTTRSSASTARTSPRPKSLTYDNPTHYII